MHMRLNWQLLLNLISTSISWIFLIFCILLISLIHIWILYCGSLPALELRMFLVSRRQAFVSPLLSELEWSWIVLHTLRRAKCLSVVVWIFYYRNTLWTSRLRIYLTNNWSSQRLEVVGNINYLQCDVLQDRLHLNSR